MNLEFDGDAKVFDELMQINNGFQDAKVFREVKIDNGRFIDLLAVSERTKLVILIENKYFSTESENQLKDYLDYVKSKLGDGYHVIPIFLTLSSSVPSDERYYSMSYEDVFSILECYLEMNLSLIPSDIYVFIKDYLAILNEELHSDQKDSNLAYSIYKENQEIIQFLFNQGQSFDLQINNWKFTTNPIRDFYEKYAVTIAFVHSVGQNILGDAFKEFAENIQLNGLFNLHFRLPSFIPSQWHKGITRLGEPLSNYWLGKGLVCWFEENSDHRLKLTVELGPIEPDARLKFLNELQKRQITIRESAKDPSRKYSKFYTDLTDINDWTDKDELVPGMNTLYEARAFQSLIDTVQILLENKPLEVLEQSRQHVTNPSKIQRSNQDFFGQAFKKFCDIEKINKESYRIGGKLTSFVLPIFTPIEERFGETREKWWWHNGPLLYWFNMKEHQLTLVLELGPIEANKRIEFLQNLEDKGLKIREAAKKSHTKYTRLYSSTKQINKWHDCDEVSREMKGLYESAENQKVLEKIKRIAEASYFK